MNAINESKQTITMLRKNIGLYGDYVNLELLRRFDRKIPVRHPLQCVIFIRTDRT